MSEEPFELPSDDVAALSRIVRELPDPGRGLPDPVFEFALAITPMINVDLMVLDDRCRMLLAWRVDPWGTGWHIPGGIIRLNEPVQSRIQATAVGELGVTVRPAQASFAMTEFFAVRGHFISLLYPCRSNGVVQVASADHAPAHGELRWFEAPPPDLYPIQREYIVTAFVRAPYAASILDCEGRAPSLAG